MAAAVKIATEIKPAAIEASKVEPSKAPDPHETVKGGGQGDGARGPKGAKFE